MSTDLVPVGQQMLAFRSLDDLERFGAMIAQSAFVPAPFRGKPGDVIAAVLYGLERGLTPMASLQGISVINGKPSIFGDMLLGICLADPSTEFIKEASTQEIAETHVAWCEAKRRGHELVRRTFSVDDAKQAKLLNKPGPWQEYPHRMLMMRARSWCLRDAYADRLMGLQAREEAQDIIDVMPEPSVKTSAIHGTESPASTPASETTRLTPMPAPAPQASRPPLDKPGLLKAIRAELARLCGESQQEMVDMARDTFGSAASSWKVVEQLPPKSLQRGLAKLQAKPTPAQPSEEADVPFEAPNVSGESSLSDHASFPDAQEGIQEDPGSTIASQDIPEASADHVVDLDALETPPESPHMQGSVVDPADVGVLIVWAGMAGQQAILDKFCADKRMENGLPVLPKITYQLIRTEVLKATGQLATKGGDRC